MLISDSSNLVDGQHGNVETTGHVRIGISNQKTRIDLLLDACDKSLIALQVKGHDDDAAQQAAKETRYPLSTVLRAQQHALTFADAARFQLACELIGSSSGPLVSQSLDPQGAAM